MINKGTQECTATGCTLTSDMKENTRAEMRSKADIYTMEYDSAVKNENTDPEINSKRGQSERK